MQKTSSAIATMLGIMGLLDIERDASVKDMNELVLDPSKEIKALLDMWTASREHGLWLLQAPAMTLQEKASVYATIEQSLDDMLEKAGLSSHLSFRIRPVTKDLLDVAPQLQGFPFQVAFKATSEQGAFLALTFSQVLAGMRNEDYKC